MIPRTIGVILLDFLCFVTSVLCRNISYNVPKVEIPGHTYLIPYGRSVMLECHVTGARPMTIEWTKRGRHLKNDKNFYTLRVPEERNRDTLLLWIRQVWEEDSGVYKCEAANTFGNTVDTFSVYGYEDKFDVDENIKKDYIIEAGYFTTENGGNPGIYFKSPCDLFLIMIISSIIKRLCNDYFVF